MWEFQYEGCFIGIKYGIMSTIGSITLETANRLMGTKGNNSKSKVLTREETIAKLESLIASFNTVDCNLATLVSSQEEDPDYQACLSLYKVHLEGILSLLTQEDIPIGEIIVYRKIEPP